MSLATTKICSFCNKNEYAGYLTIEESDGTLVPLPACLVCVDGFSKNQKIEGYNEKRD